MEQPGVRRTTVNSQIDALLPLNFSDIAKAAYAMKAEDWSDTCQGEIDVYRTCGSFRPSFVLPFVLLASFISIGWLFVIVSIRNVSKSVPVDTVSWRKHALKAIRNKESNNEAVARSTNSNNRENDLRSEDDVFHAYMLGPSVLNRNESSNST